MAQRSFSYDPSVSEMSLPEGFEHLEALENMDNERLMKQPLVNVFGVVNSSQPPMSTRLSDWKCTAEIVDISTQFGSLGMKVNFFAPREMLPQISGPGAVLRLEKIKVQMRDGRVALLTNKATKFCVMSGSDLQGAYLQPKTIPTLASKYHMSSKDMSYAIWLRHNIQDGLLPSTRDFQLQTEQAMSSKDKYSPLKDLKADKFYNLLGEIIHTFDRDGRATIYLSDYTAHALFYDYKWNGDQTESGSRDGDEYGYTTSFINSEESNWPGPYGKQCIQLTLYDEHAREATKLKIGQWVVIQNVHTKMGRDGGQLEGVLHTGMGGISIVRASECSEENEKRYEEGLRNKKAYEECFRKKELAANTGVKIKSKANSKKTRKEKRAAAEKKSTQLEDKSVEQLDLNKYIKCNNPDQPALPLSTGLNSKNYQLHHGLDSNLVRKFRAHVRVIDFFPDELENFASYDESLKDWSWGFSLRVEDGFLSDISNSSIDSSSKPRPWLLVDNSNAQFLLDLDADDLRKNKDLLYQIQEKLFILWGDLAERKLMVLEKVNQIESTQLTQPSQSMEDDKNEASSDSTPQNSGDDTRQSKRTVGLKRKRVQSPPSETYAISRNDMPPLYSDDENESLERAAPSKRRGQPLTSRDTNAKPASLSTHQTKESILAEFRRDPQAKNKAFTCCIREYGHENNTKRMLALFETRIAGN